MENTIADLYIKGHEAYLSGKYIIALRIYEEFLELVKSQEPNPFVAFAYLQLYKTSLALDEPDKAKGYYSKANDLFRFREMVWLENSCNNCLIKHGLQQLL
jgi:hypothetical protein